MGHAAGQRWGPGEPTAQPDRLGPRQMEENPAFYATAAQVIPVLLTVTVLEERLTTQD